AACSKASRPVNPALVASVHAAASGGIKISMFHVKDAEFNPTGRSGVYGGYQSWVDRPGRFRSIGDGQVDFKQVFSKLTKYGAGSWAVLEWECCMKHPEDGAREGAQLI